MPPAGASSAVNVRVGALRQVVPRSLAVPFRVRRARLRLRGRAARCRSRSRRCWCCGDCGERVGPGAPRGRGRGRELVVSFRCPAVVRRGSRSREARSWRWSRSRSSRTRALRPSSEEEEVHRTKVRVAEDVLDANATIARANREDFDRDRVAVVNLMSAPGAGKTSLARAGARAALLTSGSGCWRATSREVSMPTGSPHCTPRSPRSTPTRDSGANVTSTPTWSALRSPALPLAEIDLLVIENVGNLVCPAEFRVGEDARVMVSAVTEGEDKPLKYPLMFRTCELVLVNKIDLLPHLDFDLDRFLANLEAVNPGRRAPARQRAERRGDVTPGAGGCWRCPNGSPRPCGHERRGANGRPSVGGPGGAPRGAARAAHGGRTGRSSPVRPTRSPGAASGSPSASARGGRLVALGGSPAARSDARHVAVEFVHPVIVGKRALPALAIGDRGGELCELGASSRTTS